jgi:hypothetical protein
MHLCHKLLRLCQKNLLYQWKLRLWLLKLSKKNLLNPWLSLPVARKPMPAPEIVKITQGGQTWMIHVSDYPGWLAQGWAIVLPVPTVEPVVVRRTESLLMFSGTQVREVYLIDVRIHLILGWSLIPPAPPAPPAPVYVPKPPSNWERHLELERLWRDKGWEAIAELARALGYKDPVEVDHDCFAAIDFILEREGVQS